MPCGLFGKLPAKRDFIAVNAAKEFLLPWEEWLQGGMTGARLSLERRWLPAYLRAPLWRFWLGPEICGIPVCGVFMSSADGVGRHFPLSVFSCGEAGERFLSPLDPQTDAWCHEVEETLLDALDPELDFESYLARINLQRLPPREPEPAPDGRFIQRLGTNVLLAHSEETVDLAFQALLKEQARLSHATASYWWTIGGEGYPPAALSANGFPDRNLLGMMVSREFSPAAE
jgi:type VI secretion system protein ImpM